jgi:hypothetical protein
VKYACALFFDIETDDPKKAGDVCWQVASVAGRLKALNIKVDDMIDENNVHYDEEGYHTK